MLLNCKSTLNCLSNTQLFQCLQKQWYSSYVSLVPDIDKFNFNSNPDVFVMS